MYDKKYDAIRPYYNDEVPAVIEKLINEESFYKAIQSVMPQWKYEDIKATALKTKTTYDFQRNFMYVGIHALIKGTSKGFTFSGFENITAKTPHVFVSNHRDIFLDSGLFEVALVESGHETSQITFGSNLIVSDALNYITKINKMVTIKRNGNKSELYQASVLLSDYIRDLTTKAKETIWIAQGNGRTKNGIDSTQVGLLKMLNMSGKVSFAENFKELNIVPFSISYEYEPCDLQKAKEWYISSIKEYVKSPTEDLESIISGVVEQKGRIHLHMGSSVNCKLDEIDTIKNKNEKFRKLKDEIDRQIRTSFRLYENNYVAADLINGKDEYKEHYTEEDKKSFIEYTDKKMEKITEYKDEIRRKFIEIYANPVFSMKAYH